MVVGAGCEKMRPACRATQFYRGKRGKLRFKMGTGRVDLLLVGVLLLGPISFLSGAHPSVLARRSRLSEAGAVRRTFSFFYRRPRRDRCYKRRTARLAPAPHPETTVAEPTSIGGDPHQGRLRRGRPLRRSPPRRCRPLSLRSPKVRRRRRTKRLLRKRKMRPPAEDARAAGAPATAAPLSRRSRRDHSRSALGARRRARRRTRLGRLRKRLGRAGPFGSANSPWRSAQSCSFAIRSNSFFRCRLPRRARPRPGPRAGKDGEFLRRNERAGRARDAYQGAARRLPIFPGVC